MGLEHRHLFIISILALCLLCVCVSGGAQSQQAMKPETPAGAVIRLRFKPKVDGQEKGNARKRFFLIKGGLKENQSFIEKIRETRKLSRACYYHSIGASDALVRWLEENDCESVYCREIELKDIEGEHAVPEFQAAFRRGLKEFGSSDVARKWITVNLGEEVRSGFYQRQQEVLRAFVEQAEQLSKAKVVSVMTDRKGTAYFTHLEPGTYLISNIIPILVGDQSFQWNCEVSLKPENVGGERIVTLSTQTNTNVRCVVFERPLLPCDSVTAN